MQMWDMFTWGQFPPKDPSSIALIGSPHTLPLEEVTTLRLWVHSAIEAQGSHAQDPTGQQPQVQSCPHHQG